MPKDLAAIDALRVSLGQHSAAGPKPENQDFHGALLPTGPALALKGVTLAVADGISTSATGRQAAETVVGALMSDYYATSDAWTVRTAATRVISATNAWMHGRNHGLHDIDRGMCCTLAALILKGRDGHILHVGDSRVARLSGLSLEPLTVDHRDGASLTRAMGAAPQAVIDYARVVLQVGDVFVLSTDGLHDVLDGRAIARVIAEAPDLDAAARAAVALALERGANDNLTIQIVRIDALARDGAALALDLAQLPVPPEPKAGDVIDGFRIVRQIHATDRSHVFLALAPDGSKVAFKIPSSEHARDAAYLRRFVLEEWIARRLSSAHVLRAAPAPATRTALYVVTEFVDGRTLRQWMTDRPQPTLDEVRGIVAQLARGLRAFHRREMLHQDLRPENVMIDAEGTVRIIDLGSAAVAGVEEAAPGTLGEMPGTLQYTAPEYLSGGGVSWRSDQYALGVIAYEMLTGRLPYGAQVSQVRSPRDQARLSYAPARDDKTGVPDWMDAALRRAVHPDPLRRFDALSELEADLRRPGPGWTAARHVPLLERSPVRFWQGVSAALALLCILLAMRPWG